MYTSKEFVEFVKSMVGAPYWYGTCCYKATKSLLASKKRQYPKQYLGYADVFNKAIADKAVVCDCVGLIKGFFWSEGGKRVYEYKQNGRNLQLKYADGINDYGANGLAAYIKRTSKWGAISTMPDIAGLIVWKAGHVGVYIGEGKVVQASWMNTGCYETELSKTSFTNWGALPNLEYEQEIKKEEAVKEDTEETETVKHVVKAGESLWRISQLYYGVGSKWGKIAEANDISGTLIYAGQTLIIPEVIK